MNIDSFPLVTCHDADKIRLSEPVPCFSLQDVDNNNLWSTHVLIYENYLEKLVFRIARKPHRLVAHVQRIFYCYHANLNEQLFAAIVDFLVILNRRGLAISRRMVIGTKSRLSTVQFKMLAAYLKDQDINLNELSGNKYSIFTKGLLGVNTMVEQLSQQDESSYDPLELAYDHIEYSQLEEAKRVLEKGILNEPARPDLHHELLALYQLTGDAAGFNQMFIQLNRLGLPITAEWGELNNYFKGASIHG